jgi:hypothetical protein
MSPVPQGTAEFIAHIFQPSLLGLLILVQCVPRTDVLGYFHVVPSGLGGRVGYVKGAQKKVGIERKAKNSQCNLQRNSSTEAACFSFAQSFLNAISQLHPPITRFPANLDSSADKW